MYPPEAPIFAGCNGDIWEGVDIMYGKIVCRLVGWEIERENAVVYPMKAEHLNPLTPAATEMMAVMKTIKGVFVSMEELQKMAAAR